jgi:hypothetical protein
MSLFLSFTPFPSFRFPIDSRPMHCNQRRMAWGIQGGKRRPQVAHSVSGPPETAVRRFQGWPPTRCRRVGHGAAGPSGRESMATPCHTPVIAMLHAFVPNVLPNAFWNRISGNVASFYLRKSLSISLAFPPATISGAGNKKRRS